MKLFEVEKLKKLFEILRKQGRNCNKRYLNWDKFNPNREPCEKEVFIERIAKKLLPSRYIKLYDIESMTIKYVYVSSIRFAMGYGDDLEIWYIDYANPSSGFQNKKITFNDLLHFEGEFCENDEEHKKLLNMLKLDLPKKIYRFTAYDFSKQPKRVKKGEDPKERMKTFVDVEAITDEDACNKSRELNKGELFVTEKFEIL